MTIHCTKKGFNYDYDITSESWKAACFGKRGIWNYGKGKLVVDGKTYKIIKSSNSSFGNRVIELIDETDNNKIIATANSQKFSGRFEIQHHTAVGGAANYVVAVGAAGGGAHSSYSLPKYQLKSTKDGDAIDVQYESILGGDAVISGHDAEELDRRILLFGFFAATLLWRKKKAARRQLVT